MLKKRWRSATVVILCLLCFGLAQGSSLMMDARRQLNHSGAAFRGVVEGFEPFEADGRVYTRFDISVTEKFKGKLPAKIILVSRGGQLAGKGELISSSVRLKKGDERIFFVSRGKNPAWAAVSGETSVVHANSEFVEELRGHVRKGVLPGDDLSTAAAEDFQVAAGDGLAGANAPTSTATNLMVSPDDNLPARFLQPDSGKPIPYIIDQDYLPAGITASQAVWAVSTALNAWANVCSARFQFAGTKSFGQPAADVPAADGVLRIQLHDNYNSLQGLGELGEGGHAWISQNTSSGWTLGGKVGGNDFHKVIRAFVTLKHNDLVMQKLSTFVEVLTHEIGHALGLGHSSEADPEPSTALRESVMYYRVHDDGRGASLNQWDGNVVRQVHPWNTPPVTYGRFLDVVTGTSGLPGVNRYQLHTFDLAGGSLSLQLDNQTFANGVFSEDGTKIVYTPNAAFTDTGRLDPAGAATNSYDRVFVRCSDGVNASPWESVAVLSYNRDNYNEGVPDWWRLSYMGTGQPGLLPKTRANEDFDGDGVSNYVEWRLGTDPGDALSFLGIKSYTSTNLSFKARPYDTYDVLISSNMIHWTRETIQPSNSNAVLNFTAPLGSRGFFKLERVQ